MTDSPSPLSGLPVCQVGLIVRDIEASAARYASLLGAPLPNVILTDGREQAHTVFNGQPTEARARLAFFQLGQVSLELIQPVGGPSTWQEYLDTYGEGVHHIAFTVPDTGRVVEFLQGQGVQIAQQGDYEGGRYTYANSAPQLGVILELLENFADQ